ncbi:MAG: SpoIIE family protein phosphatase [Ignavibacteriales bacterium]|nr:SpoIIE family protein phosphatase [Ignavibacteriales bacterium]
MPGSGTNDIIQWGQASFTLPGEKKSGDLYVVKHFQDGVLVSVIDGLGHGGEAEIAARAAVSVLEKYPHESVMSLLRRTHEELRMTRGVVMSLASINTLEHTMTWLSVGNVEGILLRADRNAMPSREMILLRGGVVGYQLPQPYASVHPLSRGDTLVFATDGIQNSFYDDLSIHDSPQAIADKTCSRYCKGNDDALVLAVKYFGK